MLSRLIVIAIGASLSLPAAAEDCRLADARYSVSSGDAQLTFVPVDPQHSRAASTTNMFRLALADTDSVLEGDVIWNMGLDRPNGTLLTSNCPQADEQNCKIWEGVVYALVDGAIATLPYEDEPAPTQILLPDLGRTLYYGVWDYDQFSTSLSLGDVFDFEGCSQ